MDPTFLEVVLAVSVLAAVIMVGLLISIGNEQQRKALSELRTLVRQWALGDLEIKREKAAREIEIFDPIHWLRDKVKKVVGTSPQIQEIAAVLEDPEAIVARTENGRYLVFSPVEPSQMNKLIRSLNHRHRKKTTFPFTRLLTKQRSKIGTYELSALNAGIFFDVEADKVWRMLAKRSLDSNRLWLYDVPNPWASRR